MRKLSAYLLAALLLAACTPEQPAGENTFYVSIPAAQHRGGDCRRRFQNRGARAARSKSRDVRADAPAVRGAEQGTAHFQRGIDRLRNHPAGQSRGSGESRELEPRYRPDRRLLLARPPRTRPRACPRCRPPRLDLAQSPANDGRKRLRGNSQRLSRLGEIRGRLQTGCAARSRNWTSARRRRSPGAA